MVTYSRVSGTGRKTENYQTLMSDIPEFHRLRPGVIYLAANQPAKGSLLQ
jgi:hypothetical protein